MSILTIWRSRREAILALILRRLFARLVLCLFVAILNQRMSRGKISGMRWRGSSLRLLLIWRTGIRVSGSVSRRKELQSRLPRLVMGRAAWRNERLNNIWSPRPMSLAIVEIVEKKGPLTDVDLHKELKASFGEVSFRELNKNLMKLELGGVLRVSRLMKNKRQVELAGKL